MLWQLRNGHARNEGFSAPKAVHLIKNTGEKIGVFHNQKRGFHNQSKKNGIWMEPSK